MKTSDFRYGFRIVGACFEERRLVDAAAALSAHATCDDRAEVDREAYLSAFQFGDDFAAHLKETGSTAGFSGACWSPWIWFDIDAEELHDAHQEAGGLADFLIERYGINPGELLVFFSGSKGLHVGLPTSLWSPEPSADFHRTARRFAKRLAELASVTIDAGVYDRVRAFRAPNSRHPKTGLHKRRLLFSELLGPLDAILELARTPEPFVMPEPTGTNETAAADWQTAIELVAREDEAKAARRATGTPTLNRATLVFIREGAANGDRHRLLFSAAANLGEFRCPPGLAVALLEEPALDSGLPPKEVRRQIECGLSAAGSSILAKATHQSDAEGPQTGPDGSGAAKPPGCEMDDSGGSEGPSCQEMTGATESPVPCGLQAELARLWQTTAAETETPLPDNAEAGPPSLATVDEQGFDWGRGENVETALLAPLPVPFKCECRREGWVDSEPMNGRIYTTCGKCGQFKGQRPAGGAAR